MVYLFATVTFLIVAGVFVWFLAHGVDRFRIQEHFEARGCKLLDMRSLSGGQKWFELTKEREYEVHYKDGEGNEYRTTAKTSLWTGVEWGQEEIVRYADQAAKEERIEKKQQKLEEENYYLRRKLRKMKKKQIENDE